jgi:hypothetical protein
MSKFDRVYTEYFDIDFGFLGEQEVEVKFQYTPEDNGGREYPSSDEEFECLSVSLSHKNAKGEVVWMDIADLISCDKWDEIVEMLKESEE